ncbi:MAG: hypothetical protein ABJF11_11700 [Reichenbachiella sp.]|uniref:hypothetical protein n=1 Tax=Reichenbachiella sp. TaxID=2184521 RepID=UPI003262E62B
MSNLQEYIWISCGSADSRLELYGKTKEPELSLENTISELSTISAIRLSNYANSATDDEAAVNLIELDEIELEFPILFNQEDQSFFSLTSAIVEIEGFEGPDNKFMDMIDVSGWKLRLIQQDGEVSFEWFMISDWMIDAHPAYFPGSSKGEISIIGAFGGEEDQQVTIQIPWPLSADSRLDLGVPKRAGDRWSAPVDPRKILSVFDGAGAILKDFPLGSIDLTTIKDAVEGFLDDYNDFVRLETGIDQDGQIFFDIVIGPPDEIDIAEFGGLKLSLSGDAAILVSSVFKDDHLELSLRLFLSSTAGLKLHGPFIRKVEGAMEEAGEIMAMLPIEGANIPEFPKLEISFDLFEEDIDITMASVNLPLSWDFVPGFNSVVGMFDNLPLSIDPSDLVGFKFGSLDGDAPQVEMVIAEARFQNLEGVFEVNFVIDLNIKIDTGEPIKLIADWLFTLDTDTMAFDPAASLKVKTEFNEFTVAGLTVTGLNTLMVSFEGGNLSLSASSLKAYYGGITDGDDGGFEMEVSNLLIDGGGIDMELFLKGGVTKVSGIGESFKGAEGHVVFSRSKFQSGYIKAEGPLPWIDNATGSITLSFKEGFELDRVQADFQLGVHLKTDWWVELDLKSVNIDIHKIDGNLKLILMITGKISIVPPEGSTDTFILSDLKSASMEFKDLVLTKAFDSLPPGIRLSVVLNEPKTISIFGVFGFELRSIGIGTGFDDGQAALTIGGQVFFSSNDLQNKDPEFHKFRIGKPNPGELLPQIAFENLGLEFAYKSSLSVSGSVKYVDTPAWKGFSGHGKLTINKTVNINVILEFAMVLRESDNQKVRVWMVYAEWLDFDKRFIDKFYLRDLGVGFGWRKTLLVMDDPNLVLDNPSKGTITVGPHLPTSWSDDLEGDQARWTVVISAWMTYGLKKRNEPAPIVGDVLLGLRSDLTIMISMRGWIFGVLDELKKGSGGLRPAIIGLLYYSARNNHFLATYVVDPAAASPKGVPPALAKALIQSPFSFVLETKPGMFRLELGWPRQLTFPLGAYVGKAGFMMRTTSNSLTIGVSFEIAVDKNYSERINLGIVKISFSIKIYIGIYGGIMARIGHLPALYGFVGINAFIDIKLSIKVDLFFYSFTLSQEIAIIISARVDFGVSDAGFGMEGYATASVRIWKISFGASVAFVMNKSALEQARSRVSDGVTRAGDVLKPTRYLPEPVFLLPLIKTQKPKWRAMPVRKGDYIYLLMLPEEDSWFTCPTKNSNGTFKKTTSPNYELEFELNNVDFEEYADGSKITTSGKKRKVSTSLDWNKEVITDPSVEEKLEVGHLYYEPKSVQTEHKLIDQILEDPYLQPELMVDWRVRTEEGAKDGLDDDIELRPDIRSPKFSAEGSIYDLALEEAFRYGKDEIFSWQALTIAQTRWTEEIVSKPEVLEYMLGGDYSLPAINPDDDQQVFNRRKKLLNGLENMKSIRNGVSGTLLRQFKTLINSETSYESLEVLANSGLAFKFKISDEKNFSLKVNSIKIDQGYGQTQLVKGSQIGQGIINQDNYGVGFEQEGYQFRLKDLLEFQDEQGIHFSWELERTDDEGHVELMTEKEASGLQEENKYFEYFDHYLVERINLSSESQESELVKWEAQAGFVPAMVDIGDGNRNFYLVVPRFDFSDMFQQPAAVEDQLIYRFTAVDIFGQYSQTLEHLTSRKHLSPPPPPDKSTCDYQLMITAQGVEEELLKIAVSPSKEMLKWEGSPVRYEIWTKDQPLSSGGYYGLGDDVEDIGGSNDKPIVSPKGMRLVTTIYDPTSITTLDSLEDFSFGKVHTLFVRSISEEGNASRLIRCEHSTKINDQLKKNYAHLERIPPFSNTVIEWVSQLDMRAETIPYLEPILTSHMHHFDYTPLDNKYIREVSIKLLHHQYVDDEFLYPTGGYVVYVRDRDASTNDELRNYKKQVTVEVLSKNTYGNSPYNTVDFSKWKSNFRKAEDKSVDLPIEGYPDWGSLLLMSGTEDIHGFSDGLLIHPILEEILLSIESWTEENNGFLMIHGGGISPKEVEKISFDALSEDFDLEKDPFGMGMLQWMGRTVDLAIYQNGVMLREDKMINLINAHASNIDASHRLNLELLLNSDRQTPMNYYRLGLHPVIKQSSINADPDLQKEERFTEFANSLNQFRSILQVMTGTGRALIGFDSAGIIERYTAFIDRYAQTRGISENGDIDLSVSWYNEQGNIERSVNHDDSISFQQTHEEPLARRFAYRIKRIGRYHPLYLQLGLITNNEEEIQEEPLLVRLPRVEVPRVPVIEFLGNKLREGIQCTEWLVREHEEEAMVQSNETLRNRLGYRGLAWSLYSEVKAGWRQWSGWNGDDNWFTHEFEGEDQKLAINEQEKQILAADAKWTGDSKLKPDASLHGHPFTELLEPKGMVIRILELPYYYQYRLAAFSRADDVDSPVKLTDAVQSLPTIMPGIDTDHAGWSFGENDILKLFWKIPSVWDSFTKVQEKIWQHEEPFAKRIWDFDLKFTIQIRRQGRIIPLAYIQPEPVEEGNYPETRRYLVVTSGSYLYSENPGKVEKLAPIDLKSKFDPVIDINLKVNRKLIQWMALEDNFIFELICNRAYGHQRSLSSVLIHKTEVEI